MLWLILTTISYFFSAVASVVDKILLSGPIPKPKVYAFYIGILGIVVLFLIPFGFQVPPLHIILTAFFSGGMWVIGAIGLFAGLRKFEASRIVPAIGGFLPLFTLGFTHFFSWQTNLTIDRFDFYKTFSFVLLIFGSILINFQKNKKITLESLILSLWVAFLFALSFITAKIVFLNQPFISGLIWMRMGGFFVALSLIFSKEVQEEIFFKKKKDHNDQPLFKKPKLALIFVTNQIIGATAGILQGLAIYFVPLGMLAFINAMEGIKYVFLLMLTTIISLRLPKILSESLSKNIIIQKVVATCLIVGGLIILYLL